MTPRDRSTPAWAALLVLATLALYWRAPLLGFAGDDALLLYHLKRLGGIVNPIGFFTALDFFGFYRPLTFLSFATDAVLWSLRPAGFHITNVVLHAANGLLVMALARRIMTAPAAALAGGLFLAHTANQEPVYWIAARFDLMAAFFVLVTVLLATRERWGWAALSLVTFALGLLSKEAALAAPLVVGAYEVFVRRSRWPRVAVLLGGMLAVVGLYAAARSIVGGLDPTGGANRLPKAAMLLAGVVALVALARWDWTRVLAPLAQIRTRVWLAAVAIGSAVTGVLCVILPSNGQVAEKLSFIGFAVFYLASPVMAPPPPPYFLDPTTAVYWLGGLAALLLVSALLVAARRQLVSDGAWLFAMAATMGALVPVSSMTESPRYLYLASVGVSLGIAKAVADSTGTRRRIAVIAVGLLLATSAWQIQVKGADWAWATGMLSRAAGLVNADLPACNDGDVVFLTAPVGIRGVYSHFYQSTFSQDGGCDPASYRAVARMVTVDQAVEVRWAGPRQLIVRAPRYARNFVLSQNLREFTVPQRRERTARLLTPIGLVVSQPDGDAQELAIDLDAGVDLRRTRFYYFAEGEIRRVPAAPAH